MKIRVLYFFLGLPTYLFSQFTNIKDTIQLQGDSVVVTATRSERKLSNVTVPVSIINAKTIQQIGALRLTDVLKEQPGLTLTSGFGAGVQLQGLNPDYTIILINGEPLVGRTAGVLDLNRVALGNIKKIEIVKGPSSSLYGSEAMAGVINIITDGNSKIPLQTSLRYGTYKTIDAGVNQAISSANMFYQAYYNYYSTDGYSIRPNSASRVTTPIQRVATHQQFKYNLSNNTSLLVGIRLSNEQIKNDISVTNGGTTIHSNGEEKNKDYNVSSTLNHRFSNFLKTSFRSYVTQFNATQNLLTISGTPYIDVLDHLFNRFENQTDWIVSKKLTAIFGGGTVLEGVKSSRYDSEKIRKTNANQYAFSQWEWTPNSNFIFIGGVRFDHNQTYASAWSPKASMLYKINKQHRIRLSIGQGFKAPDFRQLYLDFTNAAAGAYSVFGTAQAQKVIEQLNTLGQIGTLYNNFYQLKALQPEYATGTHLTWEFEPNAKNFLSFQVFRNDIRNLIEVQQVGAYITGAQIYSYLNIGRAFTTGIEIEAKHQISNVFSVSAAYQYLQTGDKDQIAKIKSGIVYTRDASGLSRKLNLTEYVGLPNNSKHKAQLKLSYNQQNGWYGNVRALYRSKWAVNNTNGNEVYDDGDNFANGYIALHLSLGKDGANGVGFQLGCDNILNYIDALYLPNLPGRTFFTTLKYQIPQKHKL
jgi:outer membrane receptor for ferrienterochelin and colicins